MGLIKRFTKWMCEPMGDGEFGEDYRAIQRHTGEHMPGWDNRGVPGPMQNDAEQPRAGFANDILRQVDPDWRPR